MIHSSMKLIQNDMRERERKERERWMDDERKDDHPDHVDGIRRDVNTYIFPLKWRKALYIRLAFEWVKLTEKEDISLSICYYYINFIDTFTVCYHHD